MSESAEKIFGRLLRASRERARISLGALSRHLKVDICLVSDWERGIATIFPSVLEVEEIGRFISLGLCDRAELYEASVQGRKAHEVECLRSRVLALVAHLDEAQLHGILSMPFETKP